MNNNLQDNLNNTDKTKKPTSTGMKILYGIIAAVVAAAVVFVVIKFVFPSQKIDPNMLKTPTNVTYSWQTKQISWSEVEHADKYFISIDDGKSIANKANSYDYLPTKKTFTVKVKASDTTGTYKDSNWSEIKTFENPDEFSYQAACEFFSNIVGYDISGIENFYIVDGNTIQANVLENDIIREVVMTYDDGITSITDAIKKQPNIIRKSALYDLVNYNAAESLVKSGEYYGQLEQYRQDGWKMSVVSSVTTKFNDKTFYIYGTYKMTKGSEVKYVQCKLSCFVRTLSPYEYQNYTKDIEDISNRNVRELSFHELSAEEVEFLGFTHDL